jgi:hypothetical protein
VKVEIIVNFDLYLLFMPWTDSGKDHWDAVWQGESSIERNQFATSSVEQTTPRCMSNSEFKRQQERRDVTISSDYLKDLSIEAGGGFVGGESSNITLGQMLKAIMQGKHKGDSSVDVQVEPLSPKSSSQSRENKPHELEPQTNELTRISDEVAETLLKAYLKHISTRWVAFYRPHIQYLHKKRGELRDPFDLSCLNMVYAIAGRFLETSGETGNYFPDRHYVAALSYLDDVLRPHDLRSVQTLLLHAVYCLRAPRGLSAWTQIGLALRISIELGMHRKSSSKSPSLLEEIRKRLFWSCYCLDRQVSIILGRPFAISDRDIDVEVSLVSQSPCRTDSNLPHQLPIDVDDSDNDEKIQNYVEDCVCQRRPGTSLSCFIHMIRLRKIESHIQQSAYRVDKSSNLSSNVINTFVFQLASWKESIPEEQPLQDTELYSFDGYVYYMIYYHKTLRLLLFPHLTAFNPDTSLLVKCAEACGGVCRTCKYILWSSISYLGVF